MLITSNLVFGEWDRIFKNPMTTAAAIDRLVHHSVILEFGGRACAPRRRSKQPRSPPTQKTRPPRAQPSRRSADNPNREKGSRLSALPTHQNGPGNTVNAEYLRSATDPHAVAA